MHTLALTLPWPPSANTYWRSVVMGKSPRVLISKKGREYRVDVINACRQQRVIGGLTGRIEVKIIALPPDRRRRDIDNLLKATFDAITHSGIWHDDSQIDRIEIERGDVITGGALMIEIREIVAKAA